MGVGVKTQSKSKKPARRSTKADKGFIAISMKKLVKAPWNYKLDEADKATKLLANIRRNGQVENIVVREMPGGKFEVVNGNHRYDAFASAGVDTPMCFNVGKVTEAEAKRLAIELNETKFENDPIRLADLARDLVDSFKKDDLLSTLPWSGDELQSYVSLSGFDDPDDDKDEEDDKKAPKDDNPYLGAKVSIGDLFKSLGITNLTAQEAERVSEAILRERMDQKIPIAQKDNSPALMAIIDRYLKRSTATKKAGGKKSANRKRPARKRS